MPLGLPMRSASCPSFWPPGGWLKKCCWVFGCLLGKLLLHLLPLHYKLRVCEVVRVHSSYLWRHRERSRSIGPLCPRGVNLPDETGNLPRCEVNRLARTYFDEELFYIGESPGLPDPNNRGI